ncbi:PENTATRICOPEPTIDE REPEAT-CONTAINING PROTEIN [Salix viminalis]|uniref:PENTATRICOPEPTIDE REPEAT-CONTAINING PROTEIN n=1 Tax=Salix viminalis TaxID=40686 RepID=A0A9Q0UWK2_SALVM|nr:PENTATRICOPEPTIDE REPEAT-CONTAINING PROTEIN [Salix viminalis]
MSEKELIPNTVTYNTIMQGLCHASSILEAQELFKKMCSSGMLPNLRTYSILLDGLCKHGHLEEALKLLESMQERKLEPDIVLYNILIHGMFIAGKLEGLLKEGLSDEAYKLFRKMEDDGFLPDSCSYNVIIQGFLQNRDASTAIRLIDEMVGKRFSADSSTFKMLLDLESHDENISQFMRGSSQIRQMK